MRGRINELESLVKSLKQKLESDSSTDIPASALTSDSEIDQEALTDDFGRIHLHSSESSFVEGNHWSAILAGVMELKDYVQNNEDPVSQEEQTADDEVLGPALFFAPTKSTSKFDIIAAIPPRSVLDNMLAKYFASMDVPFGLMLHKHVFFKQYEQFWENPFDTPLMWVAILFGIVHFVAFYQFFVDEGVNAIDETTANEYRELIETSREKIVDCLKVGNWMKGTPHTIEAMIFYLQVEYARSEDSQIGSWMVIGNIVRVALKMGYHRDGSHFPQLTTFEAEMRRRIWLLLVQFDALVSSQVGLPRTIKQTQCDTAEPHNLLDEDFDDTTTTLRDPRPQSDHTLTQFLVYKGRIAAVYGHICDFTTSSRQKQYGKALKLDMMLNESYDSKPPLLNPKPMHKSIMDSRTLITHRIYLMLMYRASQITLHRRFMIPAKADGRYAYSHTICIEAALELIGTQIDLWEQWQPGRMLHGDRWKMLSMIQTEFLLATTVLCYNLNHDLTQANLTPSSLPCDSPQTRKRILEAIQGSYVIWRHQEQYSKEAKKAVQALAVVLNKAEKAGALRANGLSLSANVLPNPKAMPSNQRAASPAVDTHVGSNATSRSQVPEQGRSSNPALTPDSELTPEGDAARLGMQPEDSTMFGADGFTDPFDLEEYRSFFQAGSVGDFLNTSDAGFSFEFDFAI